MIMDEYLTYIEQQYPEREEWIKWAKEKLEWYNPTTESNDELLNDVDKNTLKFK